MQTIRYQSNREAIMALEKSVYTVLSVNKAFEVLEYLSENPPDTTLQTIALIVAMTRNKAFRLLATLCENGLLEQDKPSGSYRLGIHAFSLAQKMVRNSNVISLAHPVIEYLAKKHDEAVYMVVIRGDDVLFLDMADCGQQIKAVPLIGKTFPFFTNAAGKVMKALESTDSIEWLVNKKRSKSKNISNPECLVSELFAIRSNGGIAIESGGLGEGIISVAVAVRDYAGHVIGAITMLGPSFRFLKERIEKEIIPSMIEGAAMASQKFGYMPVQEHTL
jgi:DNA-binding IclR family transcriptional regulator